MLLKRIAPVLPPNLAKYIPALGGSHPLSPQLVNPLAMVICLTTTASNKLNIVWIMTDD